MGTVRISPLTSLETSDQCLRVALRARQIGVWVWDIREDRVEFSDGIYELHGLRRDEFGGTMAHYRALIHAEDLDLVTEVIGNVAAGRPSYNQEFRIVRPGGEIRWVSASAEVVLDDAGEPSKLLGAAIDITAAKAAGLELEQFAFRASHDLQENLRAVSSFTQLLAREVKGRLGGRADEYIGFILDGTKRMRGLVDGLLAWSRVSSAAVPLWETVDCRKIVEDCLPMLRDVIAENGGSLGYDDLPEVRGDGSQILQLFQNLLSNALKFRKPSNVLRIDISAVRQGQGDWEFCVRDNGVGFDPASASGLFTPFRRLHGRGFQGAGLGLALCRRIVERHGGQIRAEAAPGEGAAFYFTLPAA